MLVFRKHVDNLKTNHRVCPAFPFLPSRPVRPDVFNQDQDQFSRRDGCGCMDGYGGGDLLIIVRLIE
jgi:hypothetical protein